MGLRKACLPSAHPTMLPPQHSNGEVKRKTMSPFYNAVQDSEAPWYDGKRFKKHHKIIYHITGEKMKKHPALKFLDHHDQLILWIAVSREECSAPCSAHQRRMPSASDLKRLPSLGFMGRRWLQSGSFSRALFIQLTKATFSSSENRKSQ